MEGELLKIFRTLYPLMHNKSQRVKELPTTKTFGFAITKNNSENKH